jgi:hypothetical protein
VADPRTRSAARVATAIAIPVAVLVLFIAQRVLRMNEGPENVSGPPRVAATSAVSVPPRNLSTAQSAICQELVRQLPEKLGQNARRPVAGSGSDQNAVYGDPPIVVACGAALPSVPAADRVWVLSGVCWYAASAAEATVWTTLDRQIPLQVTVPRSYEGPGGLVQALVEPVRATLPAAGNTPESCK